MRLHPRHIGLLRDGLTAAAPQYPCVISALEPPDDDEAAMGLALDEAAVAVAHGDVPVGAVVLHDGEVIARRHNERERTSDPTAHAEVLALRDAAEARGTWRLDGCTLVVTLEPCVMCAGALINARVARLVFGAADPKAGATGSLYNVSADPRLNHNFPVVAGVRASEAAALLEAFFLDRRAATMPDRKDARVDEWDGLESR